MNSAMLNSRDSSFIDDITRARRDAAALIERWRRSAERPDARSAIEQHPHLACSPSLVVELAYEEYCLRVDRGETLNPSQFCTQFPDQQASLYRRLEVHTALEQWEQEADLQAAPWPGADDEFLGYRLLDELGRGTFARVYLAEETELGGRLVAIKLTAETSDEGATQGKLEHPHIMPVYSVRQLPELDMTMICMPYLGRATGADLLERRRRGVCGLSDLRNLVRSAPSSSVGGSPFRRGAAGSSYADAVLQLGCQLAGALGHAHQQGVVHRDLKPSNILLSEDGQALLLDFNLSFDRRRSGARWGGTLAYMAPERLRCFQQTGRSLASDRNSAQSPGPGSGALESAAGRSKRATDEGLEACGPAACADVEFPDPVFSATEFRADGRSDLYALALILVEWLTGESPWGALPRESSTESQAAWLLKAQQTVRLPETLPGVSRKATRLLQRCLSPDPADRPESAGAFQAELQRELSWSRRALRRAGTHRGWSLVVAAGLLLAAVIGGSYLASRPSYSQRQLTAARQQVLAKQPLDAIRHLDQSLAHDPQSVPALFLRGQLHAQQANYPSAIRDLKQAVDLSNDPQIMAYLGYCCNRVAAHSDACHWYERALALGNDSVPVLNNLGASYYRKGMYHLVDEPLSQALTKSPSLRSAYFVRSVVAMDLAKGRSELSYDALDDIEKAIESGPPCMQVYSVATRHYAYAASRELKWHQHAIDNALKAMHTGATLKELSQDPLVAQLEGLHERGGRLMSTLAPDRLELFIEPE